MDFNSLIQIINNGIPAGIVSRLASEAIMSLINKLKAKFDGKEITEEKIKQLMAENESFKETLAELQNELTKENMIINNVGKVEIKNQFNFSTLNQPTFN